jgi:hypothetical protein
VNTYTIYAPGLWVEDIRPAMEDWQDSVEGGSMSPAGRDLTPGEIEVVQQFWDVSRTVRRGKGTAHRFDLTSVEAVEFLRQEAVYRETYNNELIRFGDADREERPYVRSCERAAGTLADRCEDALREQQ